VSQGNFFFEFRFVVGVMKSDCLSKFVMQASLRTCSGSAVNLLWQIVTVPETNWHVFGRQHGTTFTFAPRQQQQIVISTSKLQLHVSSVLNQKFTALKGIIRIVITKYSYYLTEFTLHTAATWTL